MSGCSLQDAFPDNAKQSGKIAKREEREKAKRCGGPSLAFLKAGLDQEPDPDRQAQRPPPPPPSLDGHEGFQSNQVHENFVAQDEKNKEYMPIKFSDCDRKEREVIKNLIGQQVDDVIGEKSRKSLPRSAESPAQVPDFKKNMYGDPVPSYFGKSVTDGFADFSSSMTDNPGYKIKGSTFTPPTASLPDPRPIDKPSGTPLPPSFIDNAWKPLTPTGATTSYFNQPQLPPEVRNIYMSSPAPPPPECCDEIRKDTKQRDEKYDYFTKEEKRNLLNKIDTIFQKLDDLNFKSNEHSHAEITLFILSGLFLMFGFESVRKMR
jgi:hypothetical protein